jgi:formylglycine-generating enzyme required for sulfatase activity
MQLRLIQPGEFLMGSTDAERELAAGEWAKSLPRRSLGTRSQAEQEEFARDLAKRTSKQFSDEVPQHRVRITKPFCFGAYQVTAKTSSWFGTLLFEIGCAVLCRTDQVGRGQGDVV